MNIRIWVQYIPFFGHTCVSPLARHLGRFDFLMTTSSLVDQIGWEGRVMLTHFGMETNGSLPRKHENISHRPPAPKTLGFSLRSAPKKFSTKNEPPDF